MNEIKFKSISVEGFGSLVEPRTFLLDRGLGVNIVRGKNGSGKTSIFNALFWCLYGESLKEVNNSKIPTKKEYRPKTWRGTRVAITLEVNGVSFMIVRHIIFKGTTKGVEGGSTLMVFEAGELMNENLYKKDMQGFIQEILGLDSKTFLSSILFGQKMKRFIEAKPDEKRKIFESIFDTEFIEEAKEKAKEHSESLKSKIFSINSKLDKEAVKIHATEIKISEGSELLAGFENSRKERIRTIQERLESVKESGKTKNHELSLLKSDLKKLDSKKDKIDLTVLNKAKEDLEALKDKRSNLNRNLRNSDSEIQGLESQLETLEKYLTTVKTDCPSCGQNLPKTKVDIVKKKINSDIKSTKETIHVQKKNVEEIQSQIKSVDSEIEKISNLIEIKYSTLEEDFNSITKEISEVNTQIRIVESNIQNLAQKLGEYESDIKSIESESPPKIDIKAMELEVKESQKLMDELKLEIGKFEQELADTDWWIKKGFGAGGLKSFIFNAMLQSLNKSIVKYASRLGFLVKFSIDMEKASKPFLTKCFTTSKVEMDYEEFSGGEGARIDVATAFAIHDIVSSTTNINILIMDEVFESLDEDGIEDVFDLIRIKAETKSLYIITHSQSIDSLNCKHIDISKEKYNTIIN